jgi:hypothetical protein
MIKLNRVRNAAIFLTAIFACVFYSFIREPVYKTFTEYSYRKQGYSGDNQYKVSYKIQSKEIVNNSDNKKDKYLSLFFTALILFPSYLGIKNLLLFLKGDQDES